MYSAPPDAEVKLLLISPSYARTILKSFVICGSHCQIYNVNIDKVTACPRLPRHPHPHTFLTSIHPPSF